MKYNGHSAGELNSGYIMEAKIEKNLTLTLDFSLEKNDTNSNPLAKVESKIMEGLHKDTRKVV